MKHTQGPWTTKGGFKPSNFIAVIRVINKRGEIRHVDLHARCTKEIGFGDAALIAAAPDLLEACKLIRRGDPRALETARVALKKAKTK